MEGRHPVASKSLWRLSRRKKHLVHTTIVPEDLPAHAQDPSTYRQVTRDYAYEEQIRSTRKNGILSGCFAEFGSCLKPSKPRGIKKAQLLSYYRSQQYTQAMPTPSTITTQPISDKQKGRQDRLYAKRKATTHDKAEKVRPEIIIPTERSKPVAPEVSISKEEQKKIEEVVAIPEISITDHEQETKKITEHVAVPTILVIVNEQEKQLARKLIPELVIFYNDEMKRFLSEGLYAPEELNRIHRSLSRKLASDFKNIFVHLNEEQQNRIGHKLKAALRKSLPRHLQRNSENWKMKQAKISKCLQKMMSLYMEMIEKVLLQYPQGLPDHQLEIKRDRIVNRIKEKLGAEIQEKVREDEPMEGHLDSLQAEIDGYWECVVERNSENRDKSKTVIQMQEVRPRRNKSVLI